MTDNILFQQMLVFPTSLERGYTIYRIYKVMNLKDGRAEPADGFSGQTDLASVEEITKYDKLAIKSKRQHIRKTKERWKKQHY